ncbi:MAG: hypothetical protein AAFP08_14160, partial [Bacteroidota bacterium]
LPMQDFQPMHLFEQSDGLKHHLSQLAGTECQWQSRVHFKGPAGDYTISGQLDWVGQNPEGIYVIQAAEVFGKKWSGKLNQQVATFYWRAKAYGHFAQKALMAHLIWLPAQASLIQMPMDKPKAELLTQTLAQ